MNAVAWMARRTPPELAFALLMLIAAALLSQAWGLPFIAPNTATTSLVGVHYFVPLLAILLWYLCSALFGRMAQLRDLTIALAAYALVMWLHFNIKIWMPHINPVMFDEFYWQTDQALRPLVDLCIWLRQGMAQLVPNLDNLYFFGFVSLFFISFCVHAVRSPDVFRKVLLAAILLQGLGALTYLVMPALGPFLYEAGVNQVATSVQDAMLEVHRGSVAGGAPWLSEHGSDHLVAGLAAMPSLHAAGSFLFLWFVARYERPLLLLYVPIFAFILVEAVATRWHYVIDLPVGIALARLCIYLAFRLDRVQEPVAKPAPPVELDSLTPVRVPA